MAIKKTHRAGIMADGEFKDLCTAIGLMTIQWAWAESMLSLSIGVINKAYGPIKGHPDAPVSLKKKVDCLKIALRDIPQIQVFADQGRSLAKRFITLGNRRNDLIHGASIQVPTGGFETAMVKVVGGTYSIQNLKIEIVDIILLENEIAALSNDVTAFLMTVADIIGIE